MSDVYADVNGIKLCYQMQGQGYPVILVHGFGANKEGWIAQYGPLSEEFQVIRFDNRNGGGSDRPNDPLTVDILADDVRGLMDYLKIKKAHVIGWSLGGIIVQRFALKYPSRLNKSILINTVMGAPNEQAVELLKKNMIEELELRKQDPEEAFWRGARLGFYIKFRKEMLANPKKKFYGLWSVEDLIKNSIKDIPTTQDIINQSNALFKTITLNDLSKFKNPTLLLAASHDRLTSSNTMAEMHKVIPNSTLETIDKAGHSSPHSKAPEINKIIIDFLKN